MRRTALTPRRATQVVLWGLVALIAVLATWVFSEPLNPVAVDYRTTTAATGQVTPDASTAVPTAGKVAAAAAADVDLYAAPEQGRGGRAPHQDDGTVNSSIDSRDALAWEDDPKQWLPAFRWGADYELKAAGASGGVWAPVTDIGGKLLSAFATLLFTAAGFIWAILLFLSGWAFDLSVVEDKAQWINAKSAGVGRSLGTSGLLAVAVALLVVSVASTALKRGSNGVVRNIVLFLAPVALMQLMIANADTTVDTTGERISAAARLTPAGLAITGSETLNEIADSVATPLTKLTSADNVDEKAETTIPSCSWYYSRLHATYEEAAKQRGNDDSVVAIKLISRLWEQTMLKSFTDAQYGIYEEGKYAVCHQLERNRHTSIEAQAAVAGGKFPASPYYGLSMTESPSGMKEGARDNGTCLRGSDQTDCGWASVFSALDHNEQAQSSLDWAWMACRTIVAKPDGDGFAWPEALADDRLSKADCLEWAAGQWSDGDFTESTGEPLQFDDGAEAASYLGGTSTTEYRVVSSYLGGNASARMLLGFVALGTALLYTFVIGAMSLGTVVATVLFAFLLVFLPVTLFLLALPAQHGRRNALGVKLLKMTGTTMMAKVTLYLFLLVTIALVDLLNSLAI